MMNNQTEIRQAVVNAAPDIYTPVLDIGEVDPLNLEVDDPHTKVHFLKSYHPRPQHDLLPAVVALSFVGIFFITIILAFIAIIENDWAAIKDLFQLIFAAEIVLTGTAVGFYLSSGTKRSHRL